MSSLAFMCTRILNPSVTNHFFNPTALKKRPKLYGVLAVLSAIGLS